MSPRVKQRVSTSFGDAFFAAACAPPWRGGRVKNTSLLFSSGLMEDLQTRGKVMPVWRAREMLKQLNTQTHKHTTHIVLHYALSSAVWVDSGALSPTAAFSSQLPLYTQTLAASLHTHAAVMTAICGFVKCCHWRSRIAIERQLYCSHMCTWTHQPCTYMDII